MAPVRSNRLALAAAVIAAILLLAPAAAAETVMVHRRTRVMSRPTGNADTVLRVKEDRPAKVLRRGGGWVKVRIGEEVGWVPRSRIEEEEKLADEEEADEEDVEVAAANPDDDDDPDDDDAADDESGSDADQAEDEEEVEAAKEADAAAPSGAAASRVSAQAALGLRNLRSSFSSNGAMELGNYRLTARSFSAGVGLDVVAYRSGQLVGIIDGHYVGSVASPGVQFATGEEGTGYVPFTTHDIDVGARVGYGFAWLRASGRAGYHADIVHVEKVDNVGKMPSEVVRGYTVGAAIEAPFRGTGWSARASYDTLLSGARKQTSGLEDGAPGSAGASWTSLALGYALSAKLCAEIGYRRAKWTTTWSGSSAREADVTSAKRTDVVQQLTVGLAQSF
ncbi:MAG TPA: SH3 domain-containing protein [Kofleriaceae bacterium]